MRSESGPFTLRMSRLLSDHPARLLITWLLLAEAILLVRTGQLEQKSIWFDEAASWRTASFPLPTLLKSLAANVHPPLYFLILKFWCGVFGDSLTALRSCSVLWGCAAIGIGALLAVHGAEDHRRDRTVLVLALLGFSPLAVRYAREARMYALATFLVLAAAWLLLCGLKRDRKLLVWASGGVLAAAAYTHYYCLFHCLAQAVYLAGVAWHQRKIWLVAVALLPLATFLPWTWVFWSQAERVGEDYWTVPLTLERAGNVLWQLWVADDLDYGVGRAIAGCVAAIGCIWFSWRRGGPVGKLAAVHFVLCAGMAFCVSATWRSVVMPRYLAPAHALLVCGVAAAWPVRLFWGRLAALSPIAALALALLFLWPNLVPPPTHTGLRSTVAWVSFYRQPGDVVLVDRPFLYLPFRFYDRQGLVFLTAEATQGIKHYEGGPLLTVEERQDPSDRAQMGVGLWFVHDQISRSRLPSRNEDAWKQTHHQEFIEAFSWHPRIVVERWERRLGPDLLHSLDQPDD